MFGTRVVFSAAGADDQPRLWLQRLDASQPQAIAGTEGKITYLDKGEIRASVPAQDYGRAWPMWRAKALAGLKATG